MIRKTEALVLRRIEYRSTSLIVTLYSPEFGKITGLIKGIRVPKLRYSSRMEIFSLNEIIFYERPSKTIYIIAECLLLEYFYKIRINLEKLGVASYLMELINNLTALHDKDSSHDIFNLSYHALNILLEVDNLNLLMRIFEIKLLKSLGMMPNLKSCVSCNKIWSGQNARFSYSMGGIICNKCITTKPTESFVIDKSTISVINHIISIDPNAAARIKLSENIMLELRKITFDFIRYHLHKNFNSLEFLKKVVSTEYVVPSL